MRGSLLFSSLAVTILTAVHGDTLHFRADYKYNAKAKGWFKLHPVPATWQDARVRCHAEGSVLASPLNAELQDAIKELVVADNLAARRGIFTGVHSTFSNGDYFSLEGVPLSQMPISWAMDQPDNLDNSENCLVFYYNSSMADVQCSNTYKYICYKKHQLMTINNCGTVDNEYILDGRTGHCYKFHRTGLSWPRGFMTCAAEGGHLAIINGETEAQVLMDVFARNPAGTFNSRHKDIVSIGAHDWGEPGTWRTIHGQTFEEAGYLKWGDGQPAEIDKRHCIGMFTNGKLGSTWCHLIVSFICEKDPTSLRD